MESKSPLTPEEEKLLEIFDYALAKVSFEQRGNFVRMLQNTKPMSVLSGIERNLCSLEFRVYVLGIKV